jgi:hypothetical protein
MAVDRPFPKGTFKVELGPGKHEVSAIFKPTQSTIVFSRGRLWDVLDDPHLNQALGLPQNPRMTFGPYPKRR